MKSRVFLAAGIFALRTAAALIASKEIFDFGSIPDAGQERYGEFP